jgi:uncharacterized protein (TIGR03435 family)
VVHLLSFRREQPFADLFELWDRMIIRMKFLPGFLVAFVSASAVFTQTPARLEFEVASVKPAAAQVEQVNIGLHIDGAQVHINYFTLRDYIRIAYKVKDHQIVGPDWIGAGRFNIDAKLPAGAKPDQVPEMLQALLADRFQLAVHRGSKEFPVYALVVAAGGLKMKEAADSGTDGDGAPAGTTNATASGSAQGVAVDLGNGASYAFGNNRFEFKKVSMGRCADILGRFMDRPIVDMTDLKGAYDFTLDLTEEDYRVLLIRVAMSQNVSLPPQAMRLLEGATDDSVHSGLRAVGLKLDPRKAPIETIVVDHALKAPTEN